MMEGGSLDGLAQYQSIKRVRAGKITEVFSGGCYVMSGGGVAVYYFSFEPGMTARYTPVVGDWWVVYDDGYQSISPSYAFNEGYMKMLSQSGRPSKAAEDPIPVHTGLPVSGYRPQHDEAVQLVNLNKEIEERCLRAIDAVSLMVTIDKRMLAIGRTNLEQAFMWINRAIFQPSRIKLPEDTDAPTP